ncbi:hypothetical protein Dimus_010798, partial [Dionaea muscipula]
RCRCVLAMGCPRCYRHASGRRPALNALLDARALEGDAVRAVALRSTPLDSLRRPRRACPASSPCSIVAALVHAALKREDVLPPLRTLAAVRSLCLCVRLVWMRHRCAVLRAADLMRVRVPLPLPL